MSVIRFFLASLFVCTTIVPAADQRPTSAVKDIANLRWCTERILSGSEPSTEEAFRSLAANGVTTIVSVDGVTPDVESARTFGLRYIHIPIGYDNVPKKASLSLTRVVRDCEGTIFIHCHHGKHRGPAAAAIAGLADGQLDHRKAIAFLKQAGTDDDYTGLWESVRQFTVVASDAELPELTENAEVSDLATRMAEINRRFEFVGNAKQPWEERLRQAVLLHQDFRELKRLSDDDPSQLPKQKVSSTETHVKSLVAACRLRNPDQVKKQISAVSQQCVKCHKQHR